MKKLVYKSGMFALAAAMVFSFTSCEKDSGNSTSISNAVLESAEDDAYADQLFEEIDGTVESELAELESNQFIQMYSKSTASDECVVITADHPDTTVFPKVITFDYGDGCTKIINGDTITKKGKIVVTINKRMFRQGATRTITFDNFYVNDVKVEGVREIANAGMSNRGGLLSTVTVTDGKLIVADTLVYTRTAQRMREWTRAGNPLNDTVRITGDWYGNNFRGMDYSTEIAEELVLIRCQEFRHQWRIVDGLVRVTRGDEMYTIDYGNGVCTNEMVISDDEGNSRTVRQQRRNNFRNRLLNR